MKHKRSLPRVSATIGAVHKAYLAVFIVILGIGIVAGVFFTLGYSKKIHDQSAFSNSLGMKMVKIPAGSFQMGSVADIKQMPLHQVTFVRPFYMSSTVITQSQWENLMGTKPWVGENLLSTEYGPDRPATNLTLDDIVEFCHQLSEKEGQTYRLTSEAEWEYAARAGSSGKWCFGDDEDLLVQYAWYQKNSQGVGHRAPQSVGQLKPNAFGLYDMYGNVWEWCMDIWQNNYTGAPADGSAWLQGEAHSDRIMRGGSLLSPPERTTSAFRVNNVPTKPFENVSFRVVCDISD